MNAIKEETRPDEAATGCAAAPPERISLLPDDPYGLKSILVEAVTPTNFMSPYNPPMVETSNRLYRMLLDTPASDFEALSRVRREAEEGLHLSFNVRTLYTQLMSHFSPRRYVVPYDAERFENAHRICSKLTVYKDDMSGIEDELIGYQHDVNQRREQRRSEEQAATDDEEETHGFLYNWFAGACSAERVLVLAGIVLFAAIFVVILSCI